MFGLHTTTSGLGPMLAACSPGLRAFTHADQAAPATLPSSPDIQVDTVATGLEHPWGLALLPDGRFLVTERNAGHLRLGASDGALSVPLEGVPEVFRFEGETERS